jgi:glycosyltransferase involved in cell wall biosynthesis
MISVLILTLNEELNLPACLESVKESDDIVVLDDGSSDRTVEIAEAFGARVIRYSAGGERAQREYSLRSIPFKYSWVYNPDADEVTPLELWEEMVRVTSDDTRPEVAYRVRFKVMFMGRWVRRCSLYPTWVVRLFRPEALSFERETNLTYNVNGITGYLKQHFLHHSFNKGLSAWFDKHNRYSDIEAKEALQVLGENRIDWQGILSLSDPARRRKALKALAWHLPCRSGFVFCHLFFVRMGFLDGVAGWRYCRMRAMYEYMIDLKIVELRRREKGLRI